MYFFFFIHKIWTSFKKFCLFLRRLHSRNFNLKLNENLNLLPVIFFSHIVVLLEEGWETGSAETELRVLETGFWISCCKDDETWKKTNRVCYKRLQLEERS